MWITTDVHVWQKCKICEWKFDLPRPYWSLCPRKYMCQWWNLYKYCIVQAFDLNSLKQKLNIVHTGTAFYLYPCIVLFLLIAGTLPAIITSINNMSVNLRAAGTTCVPCEEGGCGEMSTSSYLPHTDTRPGLYY